MKFSRLLVPVISGFLFASPALLAQDEVSALPHGPAALDLQWQHADAATDGIIGVSSEKALKELVQGKTPVPVIVAIIDSGTESFHPDLDDNLWVNEDEVADNGIDDDKNGYIDDVHGWSFIGGPDGDVAQDNLEFTRIYVGLKKRFDGKTAEQVAASEKKDFERYQKFSRDYQDRLKKAEEEREQYDQVIQFWNLSDATLKKELKKENYTLADVTLWSPKDDFQSAVKDFMLAVMSEDFESQLADWKNHIDNQFAYSYNLDFDPRSIVGDDYSNPNERIYGNNHIDGPKGEHGTHVAGIVGAERNGTGIDGICPTARLMIIRCVPDGDERDKDVANAIRYAVDNGARVINMSFGKAFSPEKGVVDEAVRYAESKGVLLVHAAGNDGKNIDARDNFPNDRYLDGGNCKTWIEVGASGPSAKELVASFSNYGKKNVDVFAPGVEIYSTMVDGTYKKESGTSMASPVTAGVAAAVMAYYPELTAAQVRTILLKSAVRYKKTKVLLPGDEKMKQVKFGSLSATGGVVNLYEALKLASRMK